MGNKQSAPNLQGLQSFNGSHGNSSVQKGIFRSFKEESQAEEKQWEAQKEEVSRTFIHQYSVIHDH